MTGASLHDDQPEQGRSDEIRPVDIAAFARRMAECRSYDGDPEAAHCDADDLMVETLTALGYDCTDFVEMRKWYA